MRVALVDRFGDPASYSSALGKALRQRLGRGGEVFFFGGKSGRGRFNSLGVVDSGVWNRWLYPVQIVRRAIKDRVQVIHLQFEFVLFGIPFSPLCIPLLVLAKMARIKIVVTIHGPIYSRQARAEVLRNIRPSGVNPGGPAIHFFVHSFYLLLDRLSDAVIVHAEVFRQWLVEYGLRKCVVVPHGVSPVLTLPNLDECHTRANRTVLFFGFLAPRKGLETLLASFADIREEFPDSRLIIAGRESDQYRGYGDTLVRLAGSLGLSDRVDFTGYVRENQVAAVFGGSGLVVLPYVNSIAASGPLALTASFAKPLIATRIPYFTEVLNDGRDAVLVEPSSRLELTAALRKVMSDEALRSDLSKNIQQAFRTKSWEDVADQTIRVYRHLLKRSD
jgi:glycosyltransferase involved in cell wall biosynthesis